MHKAEALLFGRRDEEALALVDELHQLAAGALEERHVAMLDRMHGWLLLRRGDLDGAAAATSRAIERAEPLDMWIEVTLRAPRPCRDRPSHGSVRRRSR